MKTKNEFYPFLNKTNFWNELLTNKSFSDELKEMIIDFAKEYHYYKPAAINAFDIFKEIVKTKMAYLNSQNNPAFEILSLYKVNIDKKTITEKTFLWFTKKRDYYNREEIIVNKESDPEKFNNLLSNIGDYQIHSILRKSDNTILTVGDQTDYYCNFGDPRYYEKIGSFWLDGEFYIK